MTFPPGSSRPVRELLHEATLAFPSEIGGFDLPNARRCFSTLFDRAAQAVFRAAYDLDDVIVDQFIVLRNTDGAESDIELSEWLRTITPRTGSHVVALRLRVYLEHCV